MEFIKNGNPKLKITMTDLQGSGEYTLKIIDRMSIGENVILKGYSLKRIK
jgi:hypothetical protein